MNRRGSDFSGLSVAIVTPFKNGKLDKDMLKKQIEFQIEAGTDCLVPVGTTGESPTLSHPEHEAVIAEVIQVTAGRAKVMAGTGSNATAEAISLTKWAEKEGADATLQVAPYYNKPTQEGFVQHYKAIAESTSLPICVYNIPGRTGKNIEPETIARIAESKNVVMVKEATGSMDQASQVLSLTDLTVLSGDDTMTLPLLSIGGEGVVSVVGNLVPHDMISLLNHFKEGDLEAAQNMHHRLFPLCRDLLGLATNPVAIKAAMAESGRDSGELRLPMVALNADELAALRKTLEVYGAAPVSV
jgi:4-hydroxy-tetrahydrodipicolinate synthase